MNNLEKTEMLLSDEGELLKYIEKCERQMLSAPEDLNEKIFGRIKRKKKRRFFDILKIAACLIFSLVLSNADFVVNDEMIFNKTGFGKAWEEKISDFCSFLTTPITEKGR